MSWLLIYLATTAQRELNAIQFSLSGGGRETAVLFCGDNYKGFKFALIWVYSFHYRCHECDRQNLRP